VESRRRWHAADDHGAAAIARAAVAGRHVGWAVAGCPSNAAGEQPPCVVQHRERLLLVAEDGPVVLRAERRRPTVVVAGSSPCYIQRSECDGDGWDGAAGMRLRASAKKNNGKEVLVDYSRRSNTQKGRCLCLFSHHSRRRLHRPVMLLLSCCVSGRVFRSHKMRRVTPAQKPRHAQSIVYGLSLRTTATS
jgi:hypothetical protein